MNYFLAKTDPETFSIFDFEKEGVTNWDGVRNYTAIRTIKSWKIGDKVLIYHSMGKAKIMGIATVITEPLLDPNDHRKISWCAKLELDKIFPEDEQITLKEIKDSGLFNDFELVRISRLSTMPCPKSFIDWLKKKGLSLV
jgi:predicted RNA-binding protein with PUA-like domain